MAVFAHQNIFGLEITINEAKMMEIFERQNDLGSIKAHGILLQPLLRLALQHAEELSTGAILHDEAQSIGGLKGRVHGNNEGMISGSENFTLGHDTLDLVALNHLLLGEHLHSVETVGILEANEIHLANAAAAEQFEACEMLGADLVVLDGELLAVRDGGAGEHDVIGVGWKVGIGGVRGGGMRREHGGRSRLGSGSYSGGFKSVGLMTADTGLSHASHKLLPLLFFGCALRGVIRVIVVIERWHAAAGLHGGGRGGTEDACESGGLRVKG